MKFCCLILAIGLFSTVVIGHGQSWESYEYDPQESEHEDQIEQPESGIEVSKVGGIFLDKRDGYYERFWPFRVSR